MHQKRQTASLKLPIPRKGSAYVVRSLSHMNDSLPVLVAVRDMLHIVKTAHELKEILKSDSVKLNGRAVKDYHEGITLFSVFEAEKSYVLSLLPTKRFTLKEVPSTTTERTVKLTGKKIVNGGKVQLNFHDGTNILSDNKKLNIGDGVVIDFSNKIKKHLPLEAGSKVFIISGSYTGHTAKVISLLEDKVKVMLDSKMETTLPKESLFTQ